MTTDLEVRLQQKLSMLPDSPGVYIMKSGGEIIYIGKAVSLKNRVRQYFQSQRGHGPKVRAMVEKIDDFDVILCDIELEALLLENTLIKKHQPWYNILLKDDKHYPFIRVSMNEPFPRVELVRKAERDGARYFGPYQSAGLVRDVIEVARTIFPLRSCSRDMGKKAARPCIQFEMGRCLAPCMGGVPEEKYGAVVAEVLSFLGGKQADTVRALKGRMEEAVRQLNFERAAIYRDQISSVQGLEQKQKVLSAGGDDADVLAVAREGSEAVVQALFMRGGSMIGSENFPFERLGEESDGELLENFMLQYYDEAPFIPAHVLLPIETESQSVLEELLSQKKNARVHLARPVRGEKRKLVELAAKNAQDALQKRMAEAARKERRSMGAMLELQTALSLPKLPMRIEAFDISNTQGAQSVASMVVFVNGEPLKEGYRHFSIKTVVGADDFASMFEVLSRRFKRLADGDEKFGIAPDAVLIDGGPEQLKRALEAMRGQGFDLPMFSLAERLEEIYMEGLDAPIALPRHGEALHLIQRVRDEAHRLAITHHRKLRGKASAKSKLDDIPGIGPTRRRALLQHFGSIAKISAASIDELREVQGMNAPSAQTVFGFFHPDKGGTT